MLLSIADGRPRNLESVRTQSLFPDNVQSGAANIIAFIQEYYDYINTYGLPSSEIGSIITDKDIDVASNDYLDNIRELIAKNVPNSTSLDKVALYKIIVKYYNARGSEDSIIAFFKIFLNETVSVFYPKEYLFAPSSGAINWEPYDVPPQELDAPPVNGVPDTITVNGGGIENLMIGGSTNSLLTLGNTTALTLQPLLESDGVPITFPTLTYAGLYDGRFAYTADGTLNNILTQHYALYWDSQYTQWTLRGGGDGKTLTIFGDLYDSSYGFQVLFHTLVERGTFNGKPFYISTVDASQKCYWDSGASNWVITCAVNVYNPTWVSASDVLTPDLASAWIESTDAAGTLTLMGTGASVGYWYSEQNLALGNLQPATDQGAIWSPMLSSAVGIPFLQLVDGDLQPATPPNGNLYARTGTWPNRKVYKCTDDGSLPGHSIIWQLQNDLPGWREWKYDDHKGFASDQYKIQDSTYWQNYSYEIQSNSDSTTWRDAFLKFVHPAGLKLFTSLLLQMQSLNSWDSYISYEITDLQNPNSWLNALLPPYIKDATVSYHQHSPKYQPGWLTNPLVQYVFTALLAQDGIPLSREVIMLLQFALSNVASERQLVNQDYDVHGLKFRDPSRLGDGFLGSDRTIQSMDLTTYTNPESYRFKMLNVASIIRQGSGGSSTLADLIANYPLI
jgi:hypothetical protein